MGITIEQVDTTSASESLLREMCDYYVVLEAEEMPGDPPTPVEMRIADWRNVSSHEPVVRWVLRDRHGIAAVAVAVYDTEQNLENGYGRVHVHPGKRGRGHARAIATPLPDLLEERGCSRFETVIKKGEPADRLAGDLGLKAAFEAKRSRLTISDLDLGLIDEWIERAGERASEYHLVYHQSPIPEEILEAFCDLAYIMNTAPREEYEAEDEVLTPEHFREIESNVIGSKCQLHTVIAVHGPSGEFAGYTQIKTQDLQPDLAWQFDTGVDPAHRNKGLGRWLKADMIKRIVGAHPALARVDTFNAGSNEPMLNINVAMGFEPVHISRLWQGDLATVRERFRA